MADGSQDTPYKRYVIERSIENAINQTGEVCRTAALRPATVDVER